MTEFVKNRQRHRFLPLKQGVSASCKTPTAKTTKLAIQTFVLSLTFWAAAGNNLPNPCELIHLPENFEERVCGSLDISREEELSNLCPCEIIDGDLTISGFEESNNKTFMSSFSFSNLKEITHYLVIYRLAHLTTLEKWFPNLAVIRGQVLKGKNALVIYYMPQLQYLGLHSLTTIMRGSIELIRNQKVCFWNTIDWNLITEKSSQNTHDLVIYGQNLNEKCPSCLQSCRTDNCTLRCWGPHPEKHCQRICDPRCTGGCVDSKCCHLLCVGGCSTPYDPSSCIACRKVRIGNLCVEKCPSPLLKINDHRCVSKTECIARGYLIVAETKDCVRRFCPEGTSTCEQPCPAGYARRPPSGVMCRKCKNYRLCPKDCPIYRPGVIQSLGHADRYSGCTSVNGTLRFQEFDGGEEIQEELAKIFKNLEGIEGSLEIYESNFTSLSFLSNLRKIEGNFLLRGKYSIIIEDNPRLRTLWNSKLEVLEGAIFFQGNPELCLQNIQRSLDFVQIPVNSNDTYISPLSNGYDISCQLQKIKVDIATTDQYGAVILNVQLTSSHFLPDSIYYVFYKKTKEMIYLKDIKEKCDYDGWKMKELHFVASNFSHEEKFAQKISGLDSHSRYAFYVKIISLSSQQDSNQSSIAYGTTSEFNPSEPKNLLGVSFTSSTMELKWDPPKLPNGIIHHYVVSIERQDSFNWNRALDICKSFREMKNIVKICTNNLTCEINNAFWHKEENLIRNWKTSSRGTVPLSQESLCQEPVARGCCECKSKQRKVRMTVTAHNTHSSKFLLQRDTHVRKIKNQILLLRKIVLSCLQNLTIHLCHQSNIALLLLQNGETKVLRMERENASARASYLQDYGKDVQKECVRFLSLDFNSGIHKLFLRILEGNSIAYDGLNKALTKVLLTPLKKTRFLLSLKKVLGGNSEIEGLYQLHGFGPGNYSAKGELIRAEYITSDLNLQITGLKPGTLYNVKVSACQKPTWSSDPVFHISGSRLKLLKGYHKRKLCSAIEAKTVIKIKRNSATDVVNKDSLKINIVSKSPTDAELQWDSTSSLLDKGILAYLVSHKKVFTEDSNSNCVSVNDFEANKGKFIIWNLTPGNYSVSVRVLADGAIGPPSEYKYFIIKEIPEKEAFWPLATLGIALALVVFACSLILWKERSQHKSKNLLNDVNISMEMPECVDLEDLFRKDFIIQIDTLTVDTERPELGSGKFGKVVKGTMRRADFREPIDVAIKMPGKGFKHLIKEAQIMQDIDSPYVVKAFGVASDRFKIYYVMEFMEHLDLKTFLQKNKHWCNIANAPQKLLQMATEGADGMAYIASKQLVHRDLAARNCLLNSHLTLKIGDFGLSRDLKAEYYSRTERKYLPTRWMAPESLNKGEVTTESDIWSFGVLLWELFSGGDRPYSNYENNEIPELVSEKCYILPCPENCPEALYQIMKKCWDMDPRGRGSFLDIIFLLLQFSSCGIGISVQWFRHFFESSFFFKSVQNNCMGFAYMRHGLSKGSTMSQLPSTDFTGCSSMLTQTYEPLYPTNVPPDQGCQNENFQYTAVNTSTSATKCPNCSQISHSTKSDSSSQRMPQCNFHDNLYCPNVSVDLRKLPTIELHNRSTEHCLAQSTNHLFSHIGSQTVPLLLVSEQNSVQLHNNHCECAERSLSATCYNKMCYPKCLDCDSFVHCGIDLLHSFHCHHVTSNTLENKSFPLKSFITSNSVLKHAENLIVKNSILVNRRKKKNRKNFDDKSYEEARTKRKIEQGFVEMSPKQKRSFVNYSKEVSSENDALLKLKQGCILD